ncbi:hypothetical protein, partial [Haloferula sp.]|uniref:hypothetical protein n=1 Tax=Haloferula sp. TaxID=2497595 RepID=UPI003C71F9FB
SFRCFPPRLAATQLLPVLSPDAPEAGRSLPLRRVLALRGARGEAFTLTFTLDDTASRTGGNSNVSSFDAISDVGLSIEDFISETPYDLAAGLGSLTTVRNPDNHQFSFDFFPDEGSLPDLSGSDYDGGGDDLVLQFINFTILDFSESLLSETPPELLTPESSLVLAGTSSSFITINWVDPGNPDRTTEIIGSIETVTVIPEPSVAILALGGGMLGLLRRRRP